MKELFCAITCALFAATAFADDYSFKSDLEKLIAKNTQSNISVQVVDLENGRTVYQHQGETPLKPASTMKVLTTIAAARQIGVQNTFSTKFGVVDSAKGGAPDLYVKGEGDPFLTTEFLWVAARKIKKMGVSTINRILIDQTAFVDPPQRQGQRAYMAGPSAMSFNFNSIILEICPGSPGEKAVVTADPWEMPVEIVSSVTTVVKGATQVSANEAAPGKPGFFAKFLVNGRINSRDQCEIINRSIAQPSAYFAYTLEGFLKYLGIKTLNRFDFAAFPSGKGRVFNQPTYNLAYAIKGLNHYSTNFIAEQILYILGPDAQGERYDRQRGIESLERLLSELGIPAGQYSVHDGSGLSHDNRLSVNALTVLLSYVFSQPKLKNEFIASLPIAGISGTMKKRSFDTSNAIIRAKTGSLDGVNSLAGYIFTKTGKQYAFAIIQNNVKFREKAMELEEKIVDSITGN